VWETSDRFARALGAPHRRVTRAVVTPYGGEPTAVRLLSGRLQVLDGNTSRRRVRLQAVGDPGVYDLLSADGATLSIEHGLRYGSTTELVPVFTGEVVQAVRPFGSVNIDTVGHDYGHWLTEARFVTPWAATGSPTRQAAIAALVEAGKPGTTVLVDTTATSTVGDAVWDKSRTDAIADIARDGNLDAFFLPDGTYRVRDAKTPTSPADYTVRGGPGGTLVSGSRVRPLERRYNAVVVSTSNVAQNWPAQVAQVTDTNDPRHPSRIGLRPYFMTLPTVASAADALAVAQLNLARVTARSESLQFGAVSNPALEAGDVVRVVIPSVNREPAAIVQHIITTLTLDLMSGAMTAETRSQRSIDD